jgi:hypothetical protein
MVLLLIMRSYTHSLSLSFMKFEDPYTDVYIPSKQLYIVS